MNILKLILGADKEVNNIKVLAEVDQFPLSIDTGTQMAKYIQRFHFIDKVRYLCKVFQEDNNGTAGWTTNIKTTL